MNLSEFETNMVYTASSRTARTPQRNPVFRKQNKRSNCVVLDSSVALGLAAEASNPSTQEAETGGLGG